MYEVKRNGRNHDHEFELTPRGYPPPSAWNGTSTGQSGAASCTPSISLSLPPPTEGS